MRPSKKTAGILSALSVAAVATLAPRCGRGATLTLYYGQDPNYSNSNNSIFVSNTYNANATATDAVGNSEYLGADPTNISVSQTAPTTIVVPVGDYLSLAIDAVLTGNSNPDGGKTTGDGTPETDQLQPNYLGLASLDLNVEGALTAVPANTGNNVGPYSTAQINVAQGSNGGAYDVVPKWAGGTSPGNINDGGSLANGINAAANPANLQSNTATGDQTLEQFAAANNVASYQNATDFMDSLILQAGSNPGFVTISPQVVQSSSYYWTLAASGSSASPSLYSLLHSFGSSDVINTLPSLVIQVVQPHHPIVEQNYPADTADYGTIITSGTGDHQGTFIPPDTLSPPYSSTLLFAYYEDGGNLSAQVIGINSNIGDSSGIVQVIAPGPGFYPPIRNGYTEVYGIDVKVNGTQASESQLQILLNAIDGSDGTEPSDCVASLNDPTAYQLLSSLDTPTTNYNLFLTFTGDSYWSGYFSVDMSNFNDPNLVGYTFTAIAVVPEPASSAIVLLGVGLLSRRRRKNLYIDHGSAFTSVSSDQRYCKAMIAD